MGRGLNISFAHRQNRSLLLRLILQHPKISRAKLAEMTQLTPASVSNITGILIKERYVHEIGALDEIRSAGRRSIGLEISNGDHFTIAVHMQRQHASIGIGNLDGSVTHQTHIAIPDHPNPRDVAKDIAKVIKTKMRSVPGEQVVGVGVGTSGIVDTEAGMIYAALAYDWQQVPWASLLASETGLPVVVDNNARAMALAEMLFGRTAKSEWLAFLFAGQGIGLGVLADGKMFSGGHGIGGELGHLTINWKGESCWCGNTGCLETYLNQSRIESLLGVSPGETISTSLKNLYQRGAYFDVVDLVATALVGVVNIFNPRIIVLGGWLADAWDQIGTDVWNAIKSRTRFWNDPPAEIRPSILGEEVGLQGANAVALGRWIYGLGSRLYEDQLEAAPVNP